MSEVTNATLFTYFIFLLSFIVSVSDMFLYNCVTVYFKLIHFSCVRFVDMYA